MTNYDLSALKELLGNDDSAVKDVLTAFTLDYEKYLISLENAVSKSNAEELRKNAHAMRSVVGNFNLKKLYDIATELEAMGKELNLENSQNLFNEFKSGISDFREWVKNEYNI